MFHYSSYHQFTESVNFMCALGLTPSIPAKDNRVQVAIARTVYAAHL